MKSESFFKAGMSCFTAFAVIASSPLYAYERGIDADIYKSGPEIFHTYDIKMDNIYAAVPAEINDTAVTSPENNVSDINWHRVLGWSTLGMAVITLGSGAVISDNGHCQLAGITSGLAAAATITGYYNYGGIISFADGDWKYNTHAIMGTLAAAGFVAAVALAGEDGSGAHVATGAVSGAAFAVTLGVLYF